jgi:RNA-directed DNA polymerase
MGIWGIWDKLKHLISGKVQPANDGVANLGGLGGSGSTSAASAGSTSAASASSSTSAGRPAGAAARVDDLSRYAAPDILGISAAELRKRSLRINPYTTAWIGRVDTIPPQSDERTMLIDRGLELRGLLTRAQLDEIHRVGDLWIRHHDAVRMIEALARGAGNAAVADDRARRADDKAQRKQEAAARHAARRAAIAERRATDIVFAGRGVSSRLHDRRANVEALAALGLPLLATPADLAAALGLSIPRLRWLCFHAEATARFHYVTFQIPKRSGGLRLLASPHAQLEKAQRFILEHILGELEVTPYAHGFVAGRSTVTNARPHVGKHVVVNLDLKDFFPTITFPRVRGLFESLGYSPAAATLLALLCTEAPRTAMTYDGKTYWVAAGERALPQGACTSPAISNLVTRKLDRRLAGAVSKLGWAYTRYADDLSFSGSAEAGTRLSLLFARVRAIVTDEGFTINEAKGRVQRAARRQSVTGVVVNDKLGVPREELRRLRAVLHAARTTGLAAQNREQHPDFEAHLLGKISYIAMIDPAKGAALRAAYDGVAAAAAASSPP